MSRSARPAASVFDFACEAAGLLGLIATLMLCLLAFAAVTGSVFWICVGVAAAGTLIYLVHQLARRITGGSDLSWRQLVLATLVPGLALAVTLLIGGQRAGLFTVPVGHRATQSQRHVISVKKNADGTVTTESRPAGSDSDRDRP